MARLDDLYDHSFIRLWSWTPALAGYRSLHLVNSKASSALSKVTMGRHRDLKFVIFVHIQSRVLVFLISPGTSGTDMKRSIDFDIENARCNNRGG
jgi:hypothetical protein